MESSWVAEEESLGWLMDGRGDSCFVCQEELSVELE